MKYKFLVLFCFAYLFCSPQNPINEFAKTYYPPDIVSKEYYLNGKTKRTFTKSNGNVEGEFIEYFKTGKMFRICYLEHGQLNGTNKIFDKYGRTNVEWKLAYDTLLYYIETIYFKNGNVNYKKTLYADNDALIPCPFVKSKDNLFSTSYDFDFIFKNIKSTGNCAVYYKNGKTKLEGNYLNNMAEGIYTWYYKNGNILKQGTYHKDLEEGLYTYYSKNGTIKKTKNWKEGKHSKSK